MKTPLKPKLKGGGTARNRVMIALTAFLFGFVVLRGDAVGRLASQSSGGAGKDRVTVGVCTKNTEVVDSHDGETLFEGTCLAENDDIGADTLVGRRVDVDTVAGLAVLGVCCREHVKYFLPRFLAATDGQLDFFAVLLHW